MSCSLLWTRSSVTQMLSTIIRDHGTILAVEPAPIVSRWREDLSPYSEPNILELQPAWFLKLMDLNGFFRTDKGEDFPGSAAAVEDVDLIRVMTPLAKLASERRATVRKHRRLDTIVGDLATCSAVTFGGRETAIALLGHAQTLLSRHKPIIVLDLSNDVDGDLDVFRALLPESVVLRNRPAWDSRGTGRYLVAACDLPPDSLAAGITHMHLTHCYPNSRLVRNFSYALGILLESCNGQNLRWDQKCRGFGVALECPAGRVEISIALKGYPQDGVRVFIDDIVMDHQCRAGPTTFLWMIAEGPKHSDIIRLFISPIRVTTVQKFDEIILESVSIKSIS